MTIFENVWKLLESADFLQLVQTCSLCYTAFGVKISAQSAKAFTWKLACKHANSWFCIIIVPCFWLIVPFERKYHSFWSKTLIHDVNLMKAPRYPFYSSLGTWKIHLGPLDYTQRTPCTEAQLCPYRRNSEKYFYFLFMFLLFLCYCRVVLPTF